jgi:hypothetical protein
MFKQIKYTIERQFTSCKDALIYRAELEQFGFKCKLELHNEIDLYIVKAVRA